MCRRAVRVAHACAFHERGVRKERGMESSEGARGPPYGGSALLPRVSWGQLVLGPPGSGKTTYCAGLQQYFEATGRPCVFVNLDPANDVVPYEADVDVRDLVSLERVMEEHGLGPNGALVYCMEYLDANVDWLYRKLADAVRRVDDADAADGAKKLTNKCCYFVFDMPGQVELGTHHPATANLTKLLSSEREQGGWAMRLAAVHLVDSHFCRDTAKFISAVMVSLSVMLHLALPHVNLLSKMDLLKSSSDGGNKTSGMDDYEALEFPIEAYLNPDAPTLSAMAESIAQRGSGGVLKNPRYAALNAQVVDVAGDFGLVGFVPLQVEEKKSMAFVVASVDKANGFVFASIGGNKAGEAMTGLELFTSAFQADECAREEAVRLMDKMETSATAVIGNE